MTLSEANDRLRARAKIDNDLEVDTTDDDAMTTAIVQAAKQFSRDSFAYHTFDASFTLTLNEPEYNLLDSAICSLPVFFPLRVLINQCWLDKLTMDQFISQNPDYSTQTSQARPWCWVLYQDSTIRIAQPPNATAVAATNLIEGFYEHPTYTYAAHQATDLLGPEQYHHFIVDKAYLDNSISYMSTGEALVRRQVIENRYLAQAAKIKAENLARFRQERRCAGAGTTRRIRSIGPY